MLNKLKARKSQLQAKGGFTLVELIVVLVILAILAALLVPTLTKYIDKAKEKNAVAECRQVVMAAQTLYDEEYGKRKDATISITFGDATGDTIKLQTVADLAEVTKTNITKITAGNNNKINLVQYTGPNGIKIKYDGSSYEKVENFS